MKKLNNKGFAISTILYGLLIVLILIMSLVMETMSFTRKSSREFVSGIKKNLESKNVQKVSVPVIVFNSIANSGNLEWKISALSMSSNSKLTINLSIKDSNGSYLYSDITTCSSCVTENKASTIYVYGDSEPSINLYVNKILGTSSNSNQSITGGEFITKDYRIAPGELHVVVPAGVFCNHDDITVCNVETDIDTGISVSNS